MGVEGADLEAFVSGRRFQPRQKDERKRGGFSRRSIAQLLDGCSSTCKRSASEQDIGALDSDLRLTVRTLLEVSTAFKF